MIRLTLITLLLSGCCSKEPAIIHNSVKIPVNCDFEKFTDEEIESMTEKVGRKIYMNQLRCKVRQERINAIIAKHNELHGN